MDEQRASELSPTSIELIERGDLDDLTRHVNALVDAHDWDELAALGARCRLAFARGKQLWAVAAHIEYRLALEAPGRWGALMLETGPGRFAFGPLPEVAASTHTWAELSPHLHATPQAAMAAHERVMRGDDLTGEPFATRLPEVLDLPLRLEPWEPRYALAEYYPDRMVASPPRLPPLRPIAAGPPAAPAGARPSRASGPARADEVCAALEDLVSTWTEESNGRAHALCVSGSALDAIGALGVGAKEIVELAPSAALAMMAWAAASGGAHGRRRGAAPGRFAGWWVLAALGGLTEKWPPAPDELGEALQQVRWYAWGAGEPATGWALRLAAEASGGPLKGRAWAVKATDAV
jgi:hypothetical protein